MVRCSQCTTPAFYYVGDKDEDTGIPLCLACYGKLEDIRFRQFLMLSAGANQALDDMDSIVGIGRSGGRIPVEALARAAAVSRTYNHIKIANSNVGVINTGNLARIDAAITISEGTDQAEFAARLKDLVEIIAADKGASADQKRELVEVTTAISDQVVSKSPSKAVIASLFSTLVKMASGFNAISGAVDKLIRAYETLSGGG